MPIPNRNMRCLVLCALLHLGIASTESEAQRRTMRPVVRGKHYAVASMKPAATLTAERILQKGGNAFDAAVAGQAVLGLVDAAGNGPGSDAVLLVYDARSKKVLSVNAEGTAPRLATIEWYKKNQDGKIPVSEGLLAATVPESLTPGTFYWTAGDHEFRRGAGPAIELAEQGFPLGDSLASAIAGSKKLRKFPRAPRSTFPKARL